MRESVWGLGSRVREARLCARVVGRLGCVLRWVVLDTWSCYVRHVPVILKRNFLLKIKIRFLNG